MELAASDIIWCVDCGARFPLAQVAKANACPKCHSPGVPCAASQDVYVEVNWHELRIMAIWAENFIGEYVSDPKTEKSMRNCLGAIASRLQRQVAPTFPPLLFSQEMAQLPQELAKAGINAKLVAIGPGMPRAPGPMQVNGPGAVGHADKSMKWDVTAMSAIISQVMQNVEGQRVPRDPDERNLIMFAIHKTLAIMTKADATSQARS